MHSLCLSLPAKFSQPRNPLLWRPLSFLQQASSLRRREVILSRISIYIAFVFLFCHSVRVVPNAYELVTTYTKAEDELLSFPGWVLRFVNLSNLLVTFACSVSFYIYYRKLGTLCCCRNTQRSSDNDQKTERTNGSNLEVGPLKTIRDPHRNRSSSPCPLSTTNGTLVTKA